jgi:hypothetical protein
MRFGILWRLFVGEHVNVTCLHSIHVFTYLLWFKNDSLFVLYKISSNWIHRVGKMEPQRIPTQLMDYTPRGTRTFGHPNNQPTLQMNKVRRFEVTLRLTVSQSVCLGIEYSRGTCDQILFPVGMLLSEICSLISVGRPLWREDGSAICSVITQWSESLRTWNHTLLSRLRLPQPGGPGSRINIPQEQGGPVIPPGTGFPLRRLLRLASYDSQGYGGVF